MDLTRKQEIIGALNDMDGGDAEGEHSAADRLLCEALIEAGHKEIAEAFRGACERVGFWYA